MIFKHYTLFLLPFFLLPLTSFAEPMVINCDNYLNQNNLTVHVAPVENSIKTGENLNLNGTITNRNSFPIADYGVLLKIVRKQSDEDIKANGLNVIDQFYPLQKNYLPEQKNGMVSARNFSTIWKVPQNIASGEYGVIAYLSLNYKVDDADFNLNQRQISYFSVVGATSSDELYLDKSTVTLNGKKYSEGLIFEDIEPVKISFTISNPVNKSMEGVVLFKTYKGEINNPSNIIKSSTEYVTLHPNGAKEISYVDFGNGSANSKTVAELYYGDRKDVVNVNYKRKVDNDVSIATLGLNKFPIQKGYTVPLYICYKANDGKNYEGTKLKVDVVDLDNNLVYSDSTKTDIDSLLRGYVFPVKFSKDYPELIVKTSLEKDEEELLGQELVYSCNQSIDGKCGAITVTRSNPSPHETKTEKGVIVIITLLLFVGTAVYFLRHKKMTSPADK